MTFKTSPDRYGIIAASIHWLSALAVLFMLASGRIMDSDASLLAAILPIHVSLGLVVGILTVFRIVWWCFFDRQPRSPAGIGPARAQTARLVHLGLYGAILVMVASGIGMLALTGAAPQVFSGGPLPNFNTVPPYFLHGLMSWILIVLATFHIGAALWHQFIRRDGLIGRMRLGRSA